MEPTEELYARQATIVQRVPQVQIHVLQEPIDQQQQDKLQRIDKHEMQENIDHHLEVLQQLEVVKQDIIAQLEVL